MRQLMPGEGLVRRGAHVGCQAAELTGRDQRVETVPVTDLLAVGGRERVELIGGPAEPALGIVQLDEIPLPMALTGAVPVEQHSSAVGCAQQVALMGIAMYQAWLERIAQQRPGVSDIGYVPREPVPVGRRQRIGDVLDRLGDSRERVAGRRRPNGGRGCSCSSRRSRPNSAAVGAGPGAACTYCHRDTTAPSMRHGWSATEAGRTVGNPRSASQAVTWTEVRTRA
jgi:hypothetical protein